MEFKNYTKSTVFIQLFHAMGITKTSPLPRISFERSISKTVYTTKVDTKDLDLLKRLKSGYIELSISDIETEEEGLLEINGRKICTYIRDQRQNIYPQEKRSGYKYHLCNCRTLQMMKEQGRQHRYLATKQDDGYFTAFDTSITPPLQCNVRMELCKNCIDILIKKGMYSTPFNLHNFFKQYDSEVPKTIRYAENVTEIQTYAPNQNDIAREYKKAVNYTCSLCQVNCTAEKQCLHLHHLDGNPQNNTRENLCVLCADCHSRQPLHSHMLNNPNFTKLYTIIKALRKSQNII